MQYTNTMYIYLQIVKRTNTNTLQPNTAAPNVDSKYAMLSEMCTDAERAVKYTRVEPKKVIALYAIHQYYVYTCKYICNTMRLRHTDNYTLIKESLINAVEDLTLITTTAKKGDGTKPCPGFERTYLQNHHRLRLSNFIYLYIYMCVYTYLPTYLPTYENDG